MLEFASRFCLWHFLMALASLSAASPQSSSRRPSQLYNIPHQPIASVIPTQRPQTRPPSPQYPTVPPSRPLKFPPTGPRDPVVTQGTRPVGSLNVPTVPPPPSPAPPNRLYSQPESSGATGNQFGPPGLSSDDALGAAAPPAVSALGLPTSEIFGVPFPIPPTAPTSGLPTSEVFGVPFPIPPTAPTSGLPTSEVFGIPVALPPTSPTAGLPTSEVFGIPVALPPTSPTSGLPTSEVFGVPIGLSSPALTSSHSVSNTFGAPAPLPPKKPSPLYQQPSGDASADRQGSVVFPSSATGQSDGPPAPLVTRPFPEQRPLPPAPLPPAPQPLPPAPQPLPPAPQPIPPAPRPLPTPAPTPAGAPSAMMGMPYDFDWSVQDVESGNVYSHSESSDGSVTRGEYRVLLPDGRLQVVKFIDRGNGYEAKVSYEVYDGQVRQNF